MSFSSPDGELLDLSTPHVEYGVLMGCVPSFNTAEAAQTAAHWHEHVMALSNADGFGLFVHLAETFTHSAAAAAWCHDLNNSSFARPGDEFRVVRLTAELAKGVRA
ncbi:hypothetical protein [Cryobacterium sp. SO1]|uniref:hypothetical protein n=1 Tax=Cryobacterium sp. SO1 TaxID=1897061 RepID=UPI001022E947|nr:hypothetical protein [Cryobacterium sp. SO1]RZI35336.1 hypothetical protein BJQ95_02403 [Cryobacterium sp. SO1]